MVFALRMSLLIALWNVTSVISSAGCLTFKIVLQKDLTVDFEKSQVFGLFGKSGAGKPGATLLGTFGSILGNWLPGYLVDSERASGSFWHVHHNDASGVSDVLSSL